MVILETAAISAGGYAAYKGGKAAVADIGKKIQRRKRDNARKEERKDFKKEMAEKQKLRDSHLSEFKERAKNRSGESKKSSILSSFTSSTKSSSSTQSVANSQIQETTSKLRLEQLREKHKELEAKDKKMRFSLRKK